jgi:hypothetical protein
MIILQTFTYITIVITIVISMYFMLLMLRANSVPDSCINNMTLVQILTLIVILLILILILTSTLLVIVAFFLEPSLSQISPIALHINNST